MNTFILLKLPVKGHRVLSSVLCGLTLSAAVSNAGNGTWNTTSDGYWNNTSNWLGGGVADGIDGTATFDTAITGNTVITLDGERTIGHLVLNANQQWALAGSALTLAISGEGAPTITARGNGYHFVTAEFTGTQGFTKTGGGVIIFASHNSYTGVTTIDYGKTYVRYNDSLGASGPGNEVVVKADSPFTQFHFDAGHGDIDFTKDITLRRTQAGDATCLYNDNNTHATTLSGILALERAGSTNGVYTFGTLVSQGGMMIFAGGITGKLADGAASGIVESDANIFRIKAGAENAVANITGTISDGTIGDGGLSVYTDAASNGIVCLSAANTYSGSTVHNFGTLLISNTTGSGSGFGAVAVKNNAILGGHGIIAPKGSHGITIESDAIVAPGGTISDSTGIVSNAGEKLTVSLGDTTGDAIFERGASIRIGASGTAVNSLAFVGLATKQTRVSFNDNTVNLVRTNGNLANGLYTLVSFDANDTYTGKLALGSGFDGLNASIIYNANNIQLQIGAIATKH